MLLVIITFPIGINSKWLGIAFLQNDVQALVPRCNAGGWIIGHPILMPGERRDLHRPGVAGGFPVVHGGAATDEPSIGFIVVEKL